MAARSTGARAGSTGGIGRGGTTAASRKRR